MNLIGRLTKDPELRHAPSGMSIAALRVAVDGAGPKVDGKPTAGFFDVSVFGDQADNVVKYCGKGKQIGVTGELAWREWDAQDGTKRNAVEINARWVDFLGSKDDDGAPRATAPPASSSAATNTGGGNGSDDDIPF